MGYRRPPNPNTKYGRKRMRQDFQHRYNNEMTPEERRANDNGSALIGLIIIAVVLLIVFLFSGADGVVRYLSK